MSHLNLGPAKIKIWQAGNMSCWVLNWMEYYSVCYVSLVSLNDIWIWRDAEGTWDRGTAHITTGPINNRWIVQKHITTKVSRNNQKWGNVHIIIIPDNSGPADKESSLNPEPNHHCWAPCKWLHMNLSFLSFLSSLLLTWTRHFSQRYILITDLLLEKYTSITYPRIHSTVWLPSAEYISIRALTFDLPFDDPRMLLPPSVSLWRT